MQGLIQQLALITSQANETDEQRAERLTEAAENAGINPDTLYSVERDIREFGRMHASRHEQKVAEIESELTAFAPMLGMDPSAAGEQIGPDTAIKLASQHATARPEVTATLVKTLHESFERAGLYDELDIETPSAGDLEPAVTVGEGGE